MKVHQKPTKQATHKSLSKNNTIVLFWADLRWLLLCVALGAAFGYASDYLPWGLIIGLFFYFIWRIVAMRHFLNWVNSPIKAISPPKFLGSLSVIASQLHHDRIHEQKTQRKMLGLIKTIRHSLFSLQDSVILLDKNNQLEWWNQSAEDLLKLQSNDQGHHIFNKITGEPFQKYYQNVIANDSIITNEGIRLQSWQGDERYLQCELTPFGDEKLLIIYDVTRVQHLEQMRKDFVANVSHELRTPLTVIMGYIETFANQPDIDPKWQRGFSLMEQQTHRMNSIVNDLLMLSRLENEESVDHYCIDIPRLMMQLFDDAQIYNKAYGHLIDLHIDSQKKIIGSEQYLNSALLNLITNAIKYTPKGGEINISWLDHKEGCVFIVSDNGIGIAQQHLERLTERFYRVDSGRSRATGGTGLGLAIVKHVLFQHDAKLTIESIQGQGSTFRIFFPSEKICTNQYPTNEVINFN